ncbi:MAG: HisA/HisF-related TIM barrel protein, partial [Ilumatobacteraceae bacterium]
MSAIKTFDPSGWDLDVAVAAKGDRTVSVCIPCRNEAETVGDLVRMIDQSLLGNLVDELIVLDIAATSEQRGPDLGLISRLAESCFMPLTVGGGIHN